MYCPTPGELVTALESAPEVAPEAERSPQKACLLCGGTGMRPRHYDKDGWIGEDQERAIREGRLSAAGFQSAVGYCPCWSRAMPPTTAGIR
jgi:hypothetical protein